MKSRSSLRSPISPRAGANQPSSAARSPMSPRLRPPQASTPQSKLEKLSSSFVSLAKQNIKFLPPSAKNPATLYLDLEDNQLTSEAISILPPHLVSLNLSGNPLNSCPPQSIGSLRSLSLDRLGLNDLSNFPFLPNLRQLSLNDNSLSSFKGLQITPRLEILTILRNSIEIPTNLTIAAFGSIYIRSINNETLKASALKEAFSMSPLVGVSLRLGRKLTPHPSSAAELEFSLSYLNAPLSEFLESHGMKKITSFAENSSTLILPYQSSSIKWYKSRAPEDKKEWVQVASQTNELNLTMMMKLHLVKCDFMISEHNFSIYTAEPIGKQQNTLSLPFPLDPAIAGVPVEGSMVSIVPLPIPVRANWARKKKQIAANEDSILLSSQDVGSPIDCLLTPYSPYYQEITFSPVFIQTETVSPIVPSVFGISFPPVIIEGSEIKFNRQFYPDREGNSKVSVEKFLFNDWIVVLQLDPKDLKFTPSEVGCFLRVAYTPITADGITGPTTFFYSKSRVLPSMPKYIDGKVGGLPYVTFPHAAVGDYFGGRKGKCIYRWLSIDSTTRSQKLLFDGGPLFTPGPDLIGFYLAVEMIPVRNDGVVGEKVIATTEEVLGSPPLARKELNLPREAIIGQKIVVESSSDFFISDSKANNGFTKVKSGSSFTPKASHVGKFIRVTTEDTDTIIGEILPKPNQIPEFSINYEKAVVGFQASIDESLAKSYEPWWIRSSDTKVVYIGPSYTFSPKDVGSQIFVRLNLFDIDGRIILSRDSALTKSIRSKAMAEPTICGPLFEGSTLSISTSETSFQVKWFRSGQTWTQISDSPKYVLSLADVGCLIRAVISFGDTSLSTTTLMRVSPRLPSAVIEVSEPIEGIGIDTKLTYNGGFEGESVSLWDREIEGKWQQIATSLKYCPTSEDVGHKLRLTFVPVRKDGIRGESKVITFPIVKAADPSVSEVTVCQTDGGFLEVAGNYVGGSEGQSSFVWRVHPKEGKSKILGKTLEKQLLPPPELEGSVVDAAYLPVREDGAQGKPIFSKNKIVVRVIPRVLSAEILARNGENIVGSFLHCECKVNGKANFKWFRSNGDVWEEIEGAVSEDYEPTSEDEKKYLRCEVICSKGGWNSVPSSVVTSTEVGPAAKLLQILAAGKKVVCGMELITNLNEAELKIHKLTWQREVGGVWTDILSSERYLTTANDYRWRIRAVTSRGVVSNPTDVVGVSECILSNMRAIVRSGSIKFSAESPTGGVKWSIQVRDSEVTMKSHGLAKSARLGSVRFEAVEGSENEMIIHLDASTSYLLVPTIIDNARLKRAIGEKDVRDFLVCTLTMFAEKEGQK